MNCKCIVCGTRFEGYLFEDDCPYCDWTYVGSTEEIDENEYSYSNPITLRQAKANYAKGLNIWGEPLPKK